MLTLFERSGESGSDQRRRIAIALTYGSPCVALAISFAVIVISRSLSDPLGWYAFDPVMALNGVFAVVGSAAGGLLRSGSIARRVAGAMVCGTLAAIVYALATFAFDWHTDWI